MRKYLFIFMMLALALAACRAESNITIDINEDGSASVGAEIGFDEEFRDLISQTGQDPEELFSEDLPGEIDGVEPYTRTEGDMTFFGFAREVDDLAAFNFSEFGQEFFSDFASFSYEADDSSATLMASINSADVGGGLGDLPVDPSEITGDIFSANVVVSMPGTVVEHDADEVRGDGTLVWQIPLNGSVSISATSEFGSSSTSWILWILGGVVLVGIIAAVTATIVSRRESEKAVASAAAAHEATDQDEPTPPEAQPEDTPGDSPEDRTEDPAEESPGDETTDEATSVETEDNQ